MSGAPTNNNNLNQNSISASVNHILNGSQYLNTRGSVTRAPVVVTTNTQYVPAVASSSINVSANNASNALEAQVKDVVTSAKAKIYELQREIEALTIEYEQVSQ